MTTMRHYMELSDGICIEAYLKSELPENIVPDTLELDTTGEFLQMGTKRKHLKPTTISADEAELNLFLKYAHRLIAQGDRIMEDSRMFLAPLPIRNGLAYIGTSGFKSPTLGVYIEWWRNNKCAWTEDKSGILRPIYYIAGSPLSGRNKCAYIGADGKGHTTTVRNFSSVWSSFVHLNTHYTEAKQLYEAYTLDEVFTQLFNVTTLNNP